MNHHFLIGMGGLAAAFVFSLTSVSCAADVPEHAPDDPAGIQGMWVWQSQWVADDQNRREMLEFCERYNFNLIMMQIHWEDDEQGNPQFRHPEAMRDLLREGARRGIRIEALDGAPDMALAENQPRTLQMLDAIIDFHNDMPEGEGFYAVHYDIEPYTMDQWNDQERRNEIMHELLEFYVAARQRLEEGAPGMKLAADIPFWYDGMTEEPRSAILEFNGERKNLHKHIQDLCDYIGIMSYRRHALGSNSVVYHVANELDYAEEIGKQVVPALETIRLDDTPQITFYGTSPEEFWRQHNLVRRELGDRPGFGGMLTHSYRGMRELFGEDE